MKVFGPEKPNVGLTMQKSSNVIFNSLATSILLWIGASFAFQSSAVASDLCSSNVIQSLGDYDSHTDTTLNYCDPNPTEREVAHGLISKIGIVNGKVSKLFGVPTQELLLKGPKIQFFRGGWGALRAYGGLNDEITLEVFPHWNAIWMDESAYAHELTHFILRKPSRFIPEVSREILTSELLKEGFPDIVAGASTGHIFSLSPYLPECFTSIRLSEADVSFKLPSGYFKTDYSRRQLTECCESLTPAEITDETAYLCGRAVFPRVAPWESTPFSPKFDPFSLMHTEVSSHQLGTVLQAFLYASAYIQRVNVLDLILDHASTSTKVFHCHLSDSRNYSYEVSIPSVSYFLKRISENNHDLGATYNHFGLDLAASMDDEVTLYKAKNKALEAFNQGIRPFPKAGFALRKFDNVVCLP